MDSYNTLSTNEQFSILWIFPQMGIRSSAGVHSIENIIKQLLFKPHFPLLNKVNEYILQKSDFLEIEDKYLLINYITNYTHFAQSYVNDNNMPMVEFEKIVQDAKSNNHISSDFIQYILQYYSAYYEIDKAITNNKHLKIVKSISHIKDADKRAILYSRLYVRGNKKYRKYYDITNKKNLTSEMLLYDKISYHYKHKNYAKIISYINDLPATLHNGGLWWKTMQSMTLTLLGNGYKNESYDLLNRVHLNVTHPGYRRKEMLTGAIAMLINNPYNAYEHFYSMYSNAKTIDEKSQGAYFIAQSYLKMGNNNAYKYWLKTALQSPTTFYGSRAIDELFSVSGDFILGGKQYLSPSWIDLNQIRKNYYKKHFDSFIYKNLISEQKPYTELQDNFQEMLEIANILKRYGYLEYAKQFIINAVEQVQDLTYMKSLLDNICTKYNKYICTDAYRAAEWSGFISIKAFKTIKSDNIIEEINEHHLALLHAVIKKESNFKISASSNVGAKGMMQVMPSTARFICSKFNIKYSYTKLKHDPEYNIKLGTIYLKYLLDKYNGSYVRTLAAYNAGHGNVAKWEKRYLDAEVYQEMILMIELIPFRETRTYVKKVITWEALYGYILSLKRH